MIAAVVLAGLISSGLLLTAWAWWPCARAVRALAAGDFAAAEVEAWASFRRALVALAILVTCLVWMVAR